MTTTIDRISLQRDDDGKLWLEFYLDDVRHSYPAVAVAGLAAMFLGKTKIPY